MLIVAVLPSILFPPKKPDRRAGARPDSTTTPAAAAPESATAPVRPSASPTVRPSASAPAETVWVTSPLYRLGFTTRGGALVRGGVLGYRSIPKAGQVLPVHVVRE